jgi:chromosomal replication initiator protein
VNKILVGETKVSNAIPNSQSWIDCKEYIKKRLKKQSFDTWIAATRGEATDNGTFKIAVANQFVADWIEGHFREYVEEAFREVLGQRYEILYVISGGGDSTDQTRLELDAASGNGNGHAVAVAPAVVAAANHNLNQRYTFESLVVGDFNQFACAASMAVAEGPGMTKYNPLYIYGGTGLGKTHIVQAVGHKILEFFPNKRVMYATSEKFTSDFIDAIADRSISDFTRMYRDVDVLIIDDIQFFTGKESTQEQFFHTFNALYHSGKQIILTSDRPPKEIKGLEERLLSRFSWGLVTDLQAPDLENRTAILLKKLAAEKIKLPDDVLTYIADRVTSNIRELEGALIRLLAYASLKQVPIDLEMAQKVLSDTFSPQKRHITIEMIQKQTSEQFRIELEMMRAKKKTAKIALARQVAMYLSRSLTDNSLKAIGNAFGGRDHSTVIHACDLVSRRIAGDVTLREKIDKISAALLY